MAIIYFGISPLVTAMLNESNNGRSRTGGTLFARDRFIWIMMMITDHVNMIEAVKKVRIKRLDRAGRLGVQQDMGRVCHSSACVD